MKVYIVMNEEYGYENELIHSIHLFKYFANREAARQNSKLSKKQAKIESFYVQDNASNFYVV